MNMLKKELAVIKELYMVGREETVAVLCYALDFYICIAIVSLLNQIL